jgi:hypothetical protein
MSDRYFALRDHVGVTADGNLEPLVEIGVTASVPKIEKGELIEVQERYTIKAADSLGQFDLARFIPGTRMVHATSPQIADVLLQSGMWDEIKPPTKQEAAKQAKDLTDSREEAGTHEPDPAAPGEEA